MKELITAALGVIAGLICLVLIAVFIGALLGLVSWGFDAMRGLMP